MDGVKALATDAVFDRSTADSGRKQLGTRYDTVLHGRHLCDDGIARQLGGQTAPEPDREDAGRTLPP
jgi:hypothetical protein